MPSNLYGTANPNPPPIGAQPIGGTNVTCPAGVETNVVALFFPAAISPGWYFPAAWGVIGFSCGATPPTGVTLGFRLGNGADIASWQVWAALLVGAANVVLPVFFQVPAQLFGDPFTTQTFNFSANPVAQSITFNYFGTYFYGGWQRAPDQ